VVGLTGTPLCDCKDDFRSLLDVLKGDTARGLSDEGFLSFYNDTPLAVFPAVYPPGVPVTRLFLFLTLNPRV